MFLWLTCFILTLCHGDKLAGYVTHLCWCSPICSNTKWHKGREGAKYRSVTFNTCTKPPPEPASDTGHVECLHGCTRKAISPAWLAIMQGPCCRWRKGTGQEFGQSNQQEGKVGLCAYSCRGTEGREPYAGEHGAKGGRMIAAQMFIGRWEWVSWRSPCVWKKRMRTLRTNRRLRAGEWQGGLYREEEGRWPTKNLQEKEARSLGTCD